MVSETLTIGAEEEAPQLLKLDLGAGVRPQEGFIAVDVIAFTPETQVVNLCEPLFVTGTRVYDPENDRYSGVVCGWKPWPWEDSSVGEAHCSHFIEHLAGEERVFFFNELYRVLAPGGKATIVTPHWASCRAYGDYTHKWPPVSDFFWYYLSRKWRLGVEGSDKPEEAANAPHTDAKFVKGGYDCDFEATWGFSFSEELAKRSQDHIQFALANYRDAAQDTVCTLVSRKPPVEEPAG